MRGEYSSVKRLSDGVVIESSVRDGYTYPKLPKIVGYDMFLLKKITKVYKRSVLI